jgi:hypothetical protein
MAAASNFRVSEVRAATGETVIWRWCPLPSLSRRRPLFHRDKGAPCRLTWRPYSSLPPSWAT